VFPGALRTASPCNNRDDAERRLSRWVAGEAAARNTAGFLLQVQTFTARVQQTVGQRLVT
jgi:hypothetical protein